MKNPFNKTFWDAKYTNHKTGWDIGCISTPLKIYIDQLINKKLKILIPGAGNGYEIEYLHKKGFTNLTVVDISNQPLINIKNRIPNFPSERLILQNFFHHTESYDLIFEQTFFCALHPTLRQLYVTKMHESLSTNGKLVGVLFNLKFSEDEPPFGGTFKEYHELFNKCFSIKLLETCYNSIKQRAGSELFFIFEKK